ncbi:tetratricopeptide repeat protein [Cardinium endosymbiont of Bemisia tabaci]|uniref:tetratricopeptide repeat protein n=1 Tax=Cardinium endosymbiont of Bemisia tabaci TaxID=672794 RepID=UPI000A00378C|nr:tetratricopeptide repeat protein [Cardinium endosymbiont of Bemisia tabaci]
MIQPIYAVMAMAIFLMSIPYKGFALTNHSSVAFPEAIFHEGLVQFDEQQYDTAQKYFETYANQQSKKYKQEEASYYLVLSALENKDPHIVMLLQYFIVKHPTSPHLETVRYHLAHCFSQAGLWDKSLILYQNINPDRLAPKARAAFQYAIGHTYLQLKDWGNAKKSFLAINHKTHPYYYPAQLQMAYIAFEQGDYDGALVALQMANKKYRQETQSLILKVYHKAGNFSSLLAYVQNCPASSFGKQDQLLIADAYFFLNQYQAAVLHYQAALDKDTARMTWAKLGHALYKTEQYPQAETCFQQLVKKEDHAGQIAAYYSGLIYEKQGNLPAAIAAFCQAGRLKFDPAISDLAAIKGAGLRYQQGAIAEVIETMTAFIQARPESENLSAAQTLLVTCYYKIRAYQRAIDYMAALPYKTEPLLRLYQKVLFYEGLAAYNADRFDAAIAYLKQSLIFPFKPALVLQAQFWLGESFSAVGAYEKALSFYKKYRQQDDLHTLYYAKNLYGLAYSYFNTGHYTTAAQTFEAYITITQKQPAATHYDAILRLADCSYVKKDYEEALRRYARVYTYHPAHVRYQEALIYEILGDKLQAERCLQEIFIHHTDTKYYEKACYHKACTIFNAGRYEAAIQSFSHLIQRKPTSDLQPELLIKRGLAYENLKKYQSAAADYQAILDEYPTHLHAESALMALCNLFAVQGIPEKSDVYLKKYAHVTQKLASHSDEQTIGAAKRLFYNQAYHKVLQKLAAFDKDYPSSQWLAEAYFLMAESYYRLQKQDPAIRYYKKIIAAPQTTFHKKAWLRMADLAYQGKRFQEAITHYQKLQKMELTNKEYHYTLIGLIKASFSLKKYQITTPACLQLLNNPKDAPVETIQQAGLYLGKIALQRSEYKRAASHFLKASKPLHTVTASEAQYLLAHTAFKRKAYTTSLDILFDLVEKYPHNMHYIDGAFLLMADNYLMLGNLIQAKATLDSMIQQSKNKKNIAVAKQKKSKVIAQLKAVDRATKQAPSHPKSAP